MDMTMRDAMAMLAGFGVLGVAVLGMTIVCALRGQGCYFCGRSVPRLPKARAL